MLDRFEEQNGPSGRAVPEIDMNMATIIKSFITLSLPFSCAEQFYEKIAEDGQAEENHTGEPDKSCRAEEEDAAVKIQAFYRGYQTRKDLSDSKAKAAQLQPESNTTTTRT